MNIAKLVLSKKLVGRYKCQQIKAAFKLGIQAHEKDIISSELKYKLIDDFNMNPRSAHGYIEIVKRMMSGRQYTRTINRILSNYKGKQTTSCA